MKSGFVLSTVMSRNLMEAALRNTARESSGEQGWGGSKRVQRGEILNSALAEKPNQYLEANVWDHIRARLFDLPGAFPFSRPAPPPAKH